MPFVRIFPARQIREFKTAIREEDDPLRSKLGNPLDIATFETDAYAPMLYKRNQVEEAIARVFDSQANGPSLEQQTRIKRLLDADRALGRAPRSRDPEMAHFAFFSEAGQGKGSEVRFSDYEAFALLLALRMLQHGWPQGFVVSVLRKVRQDLAREHERILQQDPGVLFDFEAIRRNAREGDSYYGNTDPVFLALVSDERDARDGNWDQTRCVITRGDAGFMRLMGEPGRALTTLELVNSIHALAEALRQTSPKKRGRGQASEGID
jgi:hypothetical protein